jgi:hypothetical protein
MLIVHKHWLLGCKAMFWPTCFLAATVAVLAMQPARPLFLVASFVAILVLVWWLRSFFDFLVPP